MKKTLWRAAAATALGAAALGCASQASATILLATYTGAVSSGTDGLGLFGAVGGDLTGAAFVAQFRFDTTKGAQVIDDEPGEVNEVYVQGGSLFPDPSPVSGSITINGHTLSVTDAAWSFVLSVTSYNPDDHGGVTEEFGHFAEHDFDDGTTSVDRELNSYAAGILEPIYSPFGPLNFDNSIYTYPGNFGQFRQIDYDDASGDFVETLAVLGNGPDGFQTVQVEAIPEPAAWALMLSGFFGAGATLRRRRAVATA